MPFRTTGIPGPRLLFAPIQNVRDNKPPLLPAATPPTPSAHRVRFANGVNPIREPELLRRWSGRGSSEDLRRVYCEPNAIHGAGAWRIPRFAIPQRRPAGPCLNSNCLPLLHWWNRLGLAMGVKAVHSHEKQRISKYFAAFKHGTSQRVVQNILRLSAFRSALMPIAKPIRLTNGEEGAIRWNA